MDLYKEDGVADPAIKYEASDPGAGWTVTTDPVDWDHYYNGIKLVGAEYKDFRNEMITKFEPSWGTYTDDQKKALIRNYVWPSETTGGELDALYSEADRDSYQFEVMRKLLCAKLLVTKSITASSKKYFIIQVDDAGTITSSEITSDTTI